ncbi:MAG TPA: sensor histidine kinase [Thermomicrobiales bacterium]|nr:sensor histidine kinase [Thermomicrobiales bacterium]
MSNELSLTAVTPERAPRVPLGTEAPKPIRSRIRGLPILYKILIANASIVVLGAAAGTWFTTLVVHHDPAGSYQRLLALFVLVGILLSVVVNFVVLRAAFRPLAELESAALAFMGGDVAVRAPAAADSDPQIANLAQTFNAALDELAEDREELRSLASKVIRAQEDERKRISRELHDDTAQILFAQILRLTALKNSGDQSVQEVAAMLESMTVEALEGVRRLALELRPPALDDLGLDAALGELAQRFSEQLGIAIDYQARGSKERLPAAIELILYRVAQEALTNVAKHARAATVALDLDRSERDVSISVRDDGRGFEVQNATARNEEGLGLGLFGMAERVELVGGSFRIWSRPGAGCEVFAYIPIVRQANQPEEFTS